MAERNEAMERFAEMVDQLAGAPAAGAASGGDAIAAEIAGARRATGVVSLRDSEVMTRFRQELSDGLIRIDTVNQLLALATQILARIPIGR